MTDIERHADPAATEQSRMAAVHALDASGMHCNVLCWSCPLTVPSGLLAALHPAAWHVAWSLLQDEDDDVREAAALLCGSVFPDASTGAAACEAECVHGVQLRVVQALARHARSKPALLRCMLRWLCDPEAAPPPPPSAHKPSRLFEREKVNDYEEPCTAALTVYQALLPSRDQACLDAGCVEEVLAWRRALRALDTPLPATAPFDLLARVADEAPRTWQTTVAMGLRLGEALDLQCTED